MLFRSSRPPRGDHACSRPIRARRRRGAAALTAFALAVACLGTGVASAAAPATMGPAFSPVAAGVPARPAAPVSPDPALTGHPLTSATGALNNPDKGLATYYTAGTDENSASVYPHSIQWSYFALSQVMTDASNCQSYDWSAVDSMLNEVASYGNTAAIRFYLVYPSGSPADGIPACFDGHVSTRTDTYNGVTDPDYDSPYLINAIGKFVSALAARYDGDPRIGFIQVGLVGNWGENHTWPYNGDPGSGGYPNYMPTNADFAKIVDDFANDFHRTQIEVRYPYSAGGAASGLNIGYHDDSFCALEGSPLQGQTLPESLNGASWAQLQLDLNQGTENKWITDSMGGEVYPPIQANAFTNYPNGSTANDVDNMGGCINLTHATWMIDQGSQSTPSTDSGTDAAVEAMGYNFTANNAYYTPSASGSAEVGVQITNTGVAPFYYPWTMSLGLENSSGQIVQTWNTPWDIRTVMPANIEPFPDWNVSGNPSSIPYGYPQYFQTDVNLSGVPAGSYQWVMKADNPLSADSSAAKPLLFSNTTQNANGWLGLGSVTVNTAAAGSAPSAPVNLAATGTASTINLSWSAPSSGTPAGYEILRDGTVIATTQSTSYTDQFLPVSSAHSYTVKAYDAAGDTSPASAAAAASTTNGTDTTAPTVPTNVTSSKVTGDSATLTWKQSSDDTGVAGYDIYRNGSLIGSTTFTTYTDLELAGNTSYQYTIKAYDPAGNLSAPSSPANVTTGASETTAAPGAPTALASPSQTGSAIDLSWTAPTNTGAGIAGYDIYRNGTLVGTTTETEQGTAGSPSPTIYTDTGLNPGTSYTYTVAAFDAAGDTSAQSGSVSATTVAVSGGGGSSSPSVPTGLTSTSQTDSSIGLSWSSSTAGSGGSVAGYDIYRNGTKVGTSTSTTYTDSGLNASTSYTYTVDAYDTAGDTSAQSSSITASTTAVTCNSCTPPSTPGGVTADQETSGSVQISWSASTAGSGGSVAGYDVYRNGTKVGTSTSTTYTDSGLNASTSYTYTVDAYDTGGDTSAQSGGIGAATTASGVAGYEAESTANTLGGGAKTASCSACSGGQDVGYIGEGGTLTFTDVTAPSAGSYTMAVHYVDGDAGRSAVITVNGTPTTVSFTGTNDSNWNNVQVKNATVNLNAGTNTVEFSNSSAYAPDIDQVTLTAESGGGTGETVYEADASANTLAGGAVTQTCTACLDGRDVGYIGNGGTLTVNQVTEPKTGSYPLTIYYVDGDAGRTGVLTVNGTSTNVSFHGTNDGNWNSVQSMTVTVNLNAGSGNTIEFSDPGGWAADIDHITV
ncbi:fibronectin type III domain-containing protein [Actinospica sp. MGRD01-02]|uniref:Fibronectin type III domain-containing protein n=1 Tax=Actinospica acidithermotolerans TaxID=2828514 RepID=A0A941ECE0_9ACTN|nr:fibronectin type III domain-containing protein [Actinospica acidithermotolerans]MBR7827887.1 fibronectin type III domain-containing protein [Actinospica acidithermotolerans]